MFFHTRNAWRWKEKKRHKSISPWHALTDGFDNHRAPKAKIGPMLIYHKMAYSWSVPPLKQKLQGSYCFSFGRSSIVRVSEADPKTKRDFQWRQDKRKVYRWDHLRNGIGCSWVIPLEAGTKRVLWLSMEGYVCTDHLDWREVRFSSGGLKYIFLGVSRRASR